MSVGSSACVYMCVCLCVYMYVCVNICKSHLCCDTLQSVSHVGAWFSYEHRRFICILCPSNVATHIHCHNTAVHNINLYFVKVSNLLQFSKPDKVLTYNLCVEINDGQFKVCSKCHCCHYLARFCVQWYSALFFVSSHRGKSCAVRHEDKWLLFCFNPFLFFHIYFIIFHSIDLFII